MKRRAMLLVVGLVVASILLGLWLGTKPRNILFAPAPAVVSEGSQIYQQPRTGKLAEWQVNAGSTVLVYGQVNGFFCVSESIPQPKLFGWMRPDYLTLPDSYPFEEMRQSECREQKGVTLSTIPAPIAGETPITTPTAAP